MKERASWALQADAAKCARFCNSIIKTSLWFESASNFNFMNRVNQLCGKKCFATPPKCETHKKMYM